MYNSSTCITNGVPSLGVDKALEGHSIVCEQCCAPPMLCLLLTTVYATVYNDQPSSMYMYVQYYLLKKYLPLLSHTVLKI